MKTVLKEVKRVGVISFLKIFSLMGVLAGILVSVALFLLKVFPEAATGIGLDSTLITYGAIFVEFIKTIIIYSITGTLSALIYNLFAKLVGGVKLELA